MKITNNPNELIISIPKGLIELSDIQELLDLIKYKTLVSKSKATSDEVQEISDEINQELGKLNEENLREDK